MEEEPSGFGVASQLNPVNQFEKYFVEFNKSWSLNFTRQISLANYHGTGVGDKTGQRKKASCLGFRGDDHKPRLTTVCPGGCLSQVKHRAIFLPTQGQV